MAEEEELEEEDVLVDEVEDKEGILSVLITCKFRQQKIVLVRHQLMKHV